MTSDEMPRPSPLFFVQMASRFGTGSALGARLHLGVLELRDFVLGGDAASRSVQERRARFDRPFVALYAEIERAMVAGQRLLEVWSHHAAAIQDARVVGAGMNLPESVDAELHRLLQDVVEASKRAIGGVRTLLKDCFGYEVKFVSHLKEKEDFKRQLESLRSVDPELANFLLEARSHWVAALIGLRNRMEHDGWFLEPCRYTIVDGKVKVTEPAVDGDRVTIFVGKLVNRLCLFTEVVLAHVLQMHMDEHVVIAEVPPAERPKQNGIRFRPVLYLDHVERWVLRYEETTDFL